MSRSRVGAAPVVSPLFLLICASLSGIGLSACGSSTKADPPRPVAEREAAAKVKSAGEAPREPSIGSLLLDDRAGEAGDAGHDELLVFSRSIALGRNGFAGPGSPGPTAATARPATAGAGGAGPHGTPQALPNGSRRADSSFHAAVPAPVPESVGQGELFARPEGGGLRGFPLRHTKVQAEISGMLAGTKVVQTYGNPFTEKIEAVYVFPLPESAAVDGFLMKVGDRRIRGIIRERGEARRIYELARSRGQVASLLEQERPNLFTQSVANIEPAAEVAVEISYFHTLPCESGVYRYVFPMVVGHRYGGTDPATGSPRAADHERTQPPRVAPSERSGHDIEVALDVDMGIPLRSVSSPTHAVRADRPAPTRATVALAAGATISNRDFVLELAVGTEEPQFGFMTHAGSDGGFFTLLLEPPQAPRDEQVVARELFFILDSSGSMSGVPMQKSKEFMRLALSHLRPHDVFNIATFAGSATLMSEEFLTRTEANLTRAAGFVESLQGAGGTEMEKGIRLALEHPRDPARVRLVVFLTDGGVSFEGDIFERIEKSRGDARVFAFGIGSSVNRFLIEGLAEHGRGVATVIMHDESADRIETKVRKFYERIDAPVLVDVALDFGSLPVADVVPARIPDLFAGKPVTVHGRFTGAAQGKVVLRALAGPRRIERSVAIDLPAEEPRNAAMAPVWARQRIHELSSRLARTPQEARPGIEQGIRALALEFGLVSSFTSFVAVDESRITAGGAPVRVVQPVEVPAGVNYETTFGPLRGATAFRVAALGAVLGEVRDGSLVVLAVDGGSALDQAGVKPLATLEACGGTRVRGVGRLEALMLASPAGGSTQVVVRQGTDEIPVVVAGR